jgi:hypothetical protein
MTVRCAVKQGTGSAVARPGGIRAQAAPRRLGELEKYKHSENGATGWKSETVAFRSARHGQQKQAGQGTGSSGSVHKAGLEEFDGRNSVRHRAQFAQYPVLNRM